MLKHKSMPVKLETRIKNTFLEFIETAPIIEAAAMTKSVSTPSNPECCSSFDVDGVDREPVVSMAEEKTRLVIVENAMKKHRSMPCRLETLCNVDAATSFDGDPAVDALMLKHKACP